MPAILLIIALVCLPIVVGGCLAAAGYRAYRTRRLLEREDVERAHIIDDTRHGNANAIVMRALESSTTHRSWPISRTFSDIGRKHVAPVAKPLPIPKEDVKGTGGGFVTYYGSQHSNGSQDARHQDGKNITNGYPKSPYATEPTNPYAGTSYQAYPSKDIPAPQPIYISSLYGRYNSTESPRTTMYGDDAKAADAWDKIERRESLVKPRPVELPAEEFEHVDINGSSQEWRRMKRPGTPMTPMTPVGMGDSNSSIGEEDEDEWEEEDDKRMSTGSGRSIARASYNSDAGEKSATNRLSWSTQSSHPSRNSVDSGRKILPNTVSWTTSLRENGSRRPSTVDRVKALQRSESDAPMRKSIDQEDDEKKQNVAATMARLTGYAGSDSE